MFEIITAVSWPGKRVNYYRVDTKNKASAKITRNTVLNGYTNGNITPCTPTANRTSGIESDNGVERGNAVETNC